MFQITLGVRSFLYRKSQYRSLFLVCMFGVAISLTAIFVSNGMISTMNEKAKIYYGGNFAFMQNVYDEGLEIHDYKDYFEKVKSVFPKEAEVSYRLDFDARYSSFYFEGTKALQQTIKGCNFELERNLFKNMSFVSGGFENVNGTNGILISEPIAKMLNVKVGDTMTFMLRTVNDEKNTVDVEIKGIFQDSSVFGMYTSYMDFDFLKQCYGRDENFANRIVINFPGKYLPRGQSEFYQEKLEKLFDMYPLVDNKDDFLDNADDLGHDSCALIPLSANLTEVKIMEQAMDVVISFIVVMLTVIIIAGIGSTYRVLIIKRLNELGIYMAFGMKKTDIAFTLLFESFVLLIAGCIAALAVSAIFCFIISLFNFSFIPAFDLFLVKGNLLPMVDVIKSVAVIVGVIVTTSLAVLYSTWKSIRLLPANALAAAE